LTQAVCLIVNPAAGRGGIRASLPRILAAFAAHGVARVYETSNPGEEESLASSAISDGARVIVAIGGDGTCANVAAAIIRAHTACALAVVPGGTGNDFAKTLGVADHSPERIAALVAEGETTEIDVGFAEGRCFLNSCGFGFDASVLEASNRVRFLKGKAVYIYSALKQLFTYPGVYASSSGKPVTKRGRMLMLTVSNGRSLGGAFKIAPHASVLDGKLDACFFGDANVLNRAKMFVGAMKGRHVDMPGVLAATTERLELRFDFNPAMEVDGELRIATSRTVEVKCIPRALAVIAAPGALA